MGLTEIKKLREQTSLGVNDCKKALIESNGDFGEALKILKNKGIQMLEKKSARLTRQGLIESYIHFGGNLGVLVEINCETDFVARTDIFKKFVKDIAMQIAASKPEYIKKEDIPVEVYSDLKKPEEYVKQYCLLEQAYIKENKKTVADYLREVVSKSGENIVIKRFVRFSLGEENEG
ncbi:MAG: elongation factor Ts [Candidatus Omnitrophica bacterium]|nr:elongation factor Ts [Candidatus Omnitrophota bacterium]